MIYFPRTVPKGANDMRQAISSVDFQGAKYFVEALS